MSLEDIFKTMAVSLTETVHRHMQHYEVEYLQFAFRWMNNLLMRELPLRCTIRLWDTYQVRTHSHTPDCVGAVCVKSRANEFMITMFDEIWTQAS